MSLAAPSADASGWLPAIRSLDQRIQAIGGAIWIGGEPTFTDRFSEAPEWLSSALGGDKQQRAMALLRAVSDAFPGSAVLATLGRQYPGESRPRWSIGLYARRDGEPVWHGPPDPALAACPDSPWDRSVLTQTLIEAFAERGWSCCHFDCTTAPRQRFLMRFDGAPCELSEGLQALRCRASVHSQAIADTGLRDDLADAGYYLIGLDAEAGKTAAWPYLELPHVARSEDYLALLRALAAAGTAAGLVAMRLTGYPPPVDRHVQWSSLTPDPAVIEANLAPAAGLEEFFAINQRLFDAARQQALSPYRLQYNGRQSDSGGGGQLTIGGPTPETSPFLRQPQLLPRLIRYFNQHPALSYWFATDYVGSGSQAPRCDEGLRELFPELKLALEQLDRCAFVDADFLWSNLAPFLADALGNSHRSEINIEKLCNPYLGERGRQGLVELRPFRMAASVATFTALAALVRALVARLMHYPYDAPLVDWGVHLHQRFALPFFLKQDVRAVLDDLQAHGLGLGDPLAALLLDDSEWELGHRQWQDIDVRVLRAQEFWPLIGDRTAHRPADSRLVDASTARRELSLSATDPALLSDLELRINGYQVPLPSSDSACGTRLTGIRYRSFQPWQGLHPALPALDKVSITLIHPASAQALQMDLFEWRPDGQPYAGLPRDQAEAAQRRAECLVTRTLDVADLGSAPAAPAQAIAEYCIDLRWLSSPAQPLLEKS